MLLKVTDDANRDRTIYLNLEMGPYGLQVDVFKVRPVDVTNPNYMMASIGVEVFSNKVSIVISHCNQMGDVDPDKIIVVDDVDAWKPFTVDLTFLLEHDQDTYYETRDHLREVIPLGHTTEQVVAWMADQFTEKYEREWPKCEVDWHSLAEACMEDTQEIMESEAQDTSLAQQEQNDYAHDSDPELEWLP